METSSSDEAPIIKTTTNKATTTSAAADELTSKDYYFDSYSRFGIHEEMLQDEVRTMTYRDSMYHNPHLFKDKIVLDVGCGTGILCLFAIKAGAKMAIGIDCSSIIEHAREIVRANGCEDKIKLIRGKVEEVQLPEGVTQVDIIISEWMGYCLFYETMLPTVLYARDKWLRPGGLIFPDKASLYICGIEFPEKRFERVEWWANVQEFDMSCLGEVALSEPSVDFADEKQIITSTVLIKEIDILTMKVSELEFSTPFQLNVKKTERLDALLTYFTCDFSACHKRVSFTTAPLSNDVKGTHWKQTMFLLDEVVQAKKGDEIQGTFSCWPNSRNHRDLDFELSLAYNGIDGQNFNKRLKYRMR